VTQNAAEQNHFSFSPVMLNQLQRGDRCIVTELIGDNHELKRKLLDMGIIAGTKIEVTAIAPLGDPITIKALGYSLSLRRSEAAHVMVMQITLDMRERNRPKINVVR